MQKLHSRIRRQPETIISVGLLVGLSFYLLLQAVFSLQWRMMHDAPLILYPVFLLDRFGAVPYRDVFTNTFPGTLLLELWLTRLVGYGDLAFRLVDLTWLSLILLTGWHVMADFGRRVAWAAALLFGVAYLNVGQIQSFQRDFIGLLPVVLAVAVATKSRWRLSLRAFAVGLLFGMAASIKPHLALGLIVVGLFLVWEESVDRGRAVWPVAFARTVLFAALGLVLPLAVVLGWVWRMGAWADFRDMVTVYLPLYLDMTGEHVTLLGVRRWLYLLWEYGRLGGLGIWLLPAGMGVYVMLFRRQTEPRLRRRLALLGGLAFVYSIYVLMGGKFWSYHWIPFQYFLLLLASLSMAVPTATNTRGGERLFPVLALALAVVLSFPPTTDFVTEAFGYPPRQPNDGRVDEIAEFLQTHLQPGDMVQQLDWTGGATQAMLIAGARMATPYMEDYTFYHHVSHPYIQAQRQRFMEAMRQNSPRFVIAVSDSPRPRGRDASADFPELQQFLQAQYQPVASGDGYVILEHR